MSTKRILYIIIGVTLLTGCTDGRVEATLSQIDTLMEAHPDSALQRLDSLKSQKGSWSKKLRMRFDLLEAKAQNKAFVDFTSDSIAKNFTAYYDSHGTANERMMAHYLLGCVYRDLGEAPHAVDCYLDAISQADTTAKDCDFYTLSAAYAQMASVYYDQLLLSNSINARKQASFFAYKANKPILAISDLDRIASAYILLNKTDSAEVILKDVQRLYLRYGRFQEALQSSTKLMHIYLSVPNKLAEVKILIDKYEAEANDFDEKHELNGSKRKFYFYKGKYYEEINQLDSAEFYYRKLYHSNMPYTSLNSMNGGLFKVFAIRHQPDSIAKYAQLYCLVNDSSIAKKDQELTAQMAASYNYNRYQKEAFNKEKKIHHTQLILVFFLIMGTIVALIIYAKWRTNLKKQELLRAEYANATDEYFKNLHTLQILESARKEVICNIQDELKKVTTENQNYRLSVMELNSQYENTKRELIQENEMLQSKIEELKRQDGIRQEIIKNQELGETDIVKRILFIAGHPLTNMTENEWEKFITVFAHHYPSLLHDLNMSTKITQQEVRACLLICLSLRESDIAHMLDTSAQRITNIKMSLNKILFDDNSARSLYKNLSQRYGICSL